MANRHMKRCSASLVIREMQIETTVGYHLTPVRMLISQIYKQQMLESMGRKGNLPMCWWGGKWVWSLWKLVWSILFKKKKTKLKTELSCDPAIRLLSLYPPPSKILILSDTCTPVLVAALLTIFLEAAQMPTYR